MSEKRQERIRKSHIKDDEIVRDSAMRKCLSTQEGRRMFWHLLSMTGISQNPHRGNALDSAFASGMLQAGQNIEDLMCSVDPKAWLLMLEENLVIQENLAARLSTIKDDDDEYSADPE